MEPSQNPVVENAPAPIIQSRLPVNMRMQLAKEAEDITRRLGTPTGNAIRITQDKRFTFPDGTVHPGPFQAIVVEFASQNVYYPNDFDRNVREDPVCFATNAVETELAPSARAPQPQSKTCAVCPQNRFGSGKGNAKACKNTKVLALIKPDADDDDKTIYVLRLSPTGGKNFDSYVRRLANDPNYAIDGGEPILAVSTIGFDSAVTYATVTFGEPQPAPIELLAKALSLRAEATAIVMKEPELRAAANDPDAGPAPAQTAPQAPQAQAPQAPAPQAQAPRPAVASRAGVIPRVRR